METLLLGEIEATSLLNAFNPTHHTCAACGETGRYWEMRYAIAYGQDVALCDEECYQMLMANWRPTVRKM